MHSPFAGKQTRRGKIDEGERHKAFECSLSIRWPLSQRFGPAEVVTILLLGANYVNLYTELAVLALMEGIEGI
jgi:hypothetical protein